MLRAIAWAVGSVAVVTLLRWPLSPVLGQQQSYLLFVLAVLAASLRAGLWSGVLAAVLGGLVGSYLFGGDLASAGNVTRLLLFVFVAGGVLAVTRAEEGSRARLRSELAERERLNAELQSVLSERARNATEAQRVRDALSESEGRFRTMADATPLMVWLADTDEKPDWFNQSWLAFTGREGTGGAGGVDWAADVHPEDRGPLVAALKKAFGERAPFEIEYRLRRADGQYRWVLDRGTPRFAPDGGFTGIIGTGLDIHDRRFVERRDRFLAQTANAMGATPDIEEAFQKVARLAVPLLADVCLIHLKDGGEHGRLRFAHQDAERETMLGDLAARYPASAALPCFPTVLRTGEALLLTDVTRAVLELTAQDEAHLELMTSLEWKSALCVPLRARGRLLGALGLATVADRPRLGPSDQPFVQELAQYLAAALDNAHLLREAQESYEQAKESGRLKDEFLATLSHELRTPLNAIVGWSRLLLDGQLDPEDSKRAVETINRNAAAQNQLIADMLDVSRIVSGKLRLDLRSVDPGAVIRSAVDTVLPAAQAKGISLQTVMDPGAGPITGDPDRLQQIVWNLLSNAIKFTPRGGRVLIRLEQPNSHIAITVEDNGPGIDAGFLPYVFDRFRQADASSTRRHGGLGLGLAIVRHLTELHGGTVHVENRGAENGAVFTIKLPRRAVAASAATAQERHPADDPGADEVAISLAGVTVLAIDDQQDALDLVSAVLARRGAHVFTALSAADGLEVLTRERPDVVLADVEMPGESGLEFIRRVRALPPGEGGGTPAAALTAYASSADRTHALLAGFDMHVPKPVQPVELAAVVARLSGRGA
jgi:PAS domain S-box-containing protein